MAIHKERISNRRYPRIICKKTGCDKLFIPTDARQIYCCNQHRIDHNNDLRKTKTIHGINLQKIHLHNENILKKIYDKLSLTQYSLATMSLLEYEQYEFQYYTDRTINEETNREVLWCHNYGIEGFNKVNLNFKIQYRKIIPYGEQI